MDGWMFFQMDVLISQDCHLVVVGVTERNVERWSVDRPTRVHSEYHENNNGL